VTPELRTAVDALRAGDPVVIPTDTVYGIAALPSVAGAVERVFALKTRPPDKPLPVLGDDVASLRSVVIFDDVAEELGSRFWPGPLTIVLPRAPGFDHHLGGETEDVGVRVPDRQTTRELLRIAGPLAVTSANPSGDPPASTADEARAYFGNELVVLDDGPADGAPSTVVAVAGGVRILRTGAITPAQLGL
jgi:L-threonylcarbamoyladenylate synthase